jgi:sulfatase maturation enzyme AslB (radical SAM superfamily)
MPAVFPLLEEAEAFRPVYTDEWPIFRWDCAEYAMFYAPGYLCVVGLSDAEWFETTINPPEAPLESESDASVEHDRGSELWRRAELAVAEARRWQEESFRPECLTLYMNNECNLGCVYCHTDPSHGPATRLGLEAIAAAAEVVAENCRRKGRPFYGVFHGGGEPTLHRERVESALDLLNAVASAHGVELFRYVATNGVMPEKKAVWLSRHFDLIGLSCDGPADIQNSQRPRWDGSATSHVVERTGRALREEGCRLHVRTTITAATLHRQAEIADYICQQFAPEEIHFEPVYRSRRTDAATELGTHQAGEFVTHFLKARKIARERGILLMSSGSRLDSIHGPYCHVFRDTLNLVPGGVATACFEVTDAAQVEEKGVTIGALNRETGRFEIDQSRVQELRRRLGAIPANCVGCFNRYHCVRECPDRCPLDEDTRFGNGAPGPGFRCWAQKALAYAILRETAERLWSEKVMAGKAGKRVYGTAVLRSVFPVESGGN